MHLILALLFASRLAFAAPEIRVFTQPLDHTGKAGGIISQRVQIENLQQADKKTAPVIFFVAGEGDSMDVSVYRYIYQQTTQYHKGFITIVADHRGYGLFSADSDQSVPKYVTVDQTIEDFH